MTPRKKTPLAKHRIDGEWQDSVSVVLVFHFPFENVDEERNLCKRNCNAKDVQDLRETFGLFSKCTFVAVQSPSRTEILETLSESGLKGVVSGERNSKTKSAQKEKKRLLEDEVPPIILKVLVLSHGGDGGVIFTDTSREQFTTLEVISALDQNAFLEDTLKMVYFGPCKGGLTEVRLPRTVPFQVHQGSLSVLQESSKRNMVVFNASLEGTEAYNDVGGSWMVNALCKTLTAQQKNADAVEFCRMVAQEISFRSTLEANQCSQYSVTQHPNILFCLRNVPSVTADAIGATENVIEMTNVDCYHWSNVESRGLAPIFVPQGSHLGTDLCEALQLLGFRTETHDFERIESTLDQIAGIDQLEREASLVVAAICNIVVSETEGRPELAVEVEGCLVPIRELTKKFIVASCPALTSRPKVFLFFDTHVETDSCANGIRIVTMEQRGDFPELESSLNHADFLVATAYGKDSVEVFVEGLTRQEKTLQNVLLSTTAPNPSGHHVGLIWSTMTLRLDLYPVSELDLYKLERLRRRKLNLLLLGTLVLATALMLGTVAAVLAGCSYGENSLQDVVDMLDEMNKTRPFASNARVALWRKYSYSSHGECEFPMRLIQESAKDVADSWRRGQTEALSKERKHLWEGVEAFQLKLSSNVLKNKLQEMVEGHNQTLQAKLDEAVTVNGMVAAKMRFVSFLLETGDLYNATLEFKAHLVNRNDLAGVLVVGALAGGTTNPDGVATFAALIGQYYSGYVAMNALFEDATRKGQQLSNISTLILYFGLRQLIINNDPPKFNECFECIIDLRRKMSPRAEVILDALVSDISKGEFRRPLEVEKALSLIHVLGNLFLKEVVNRSLATADFKMLYAFVDKLPVWGSVCPALNFTWTTLSKDSDARFKLQQVSLYAEYRANGTAEMVGHGKEAFWNMCRGVADASGGLRDALIRDYVDLAKAKNFSQIESWHRDYVGMRVLLSEAFDRMSQMDMEDGKFEVLTDAVNHLELRQVQADRCWAVRAMRKKLARVGMLGSPEHLSTLYLANKTVNAPGFKNLSSRDANMCREALVDPPKLFHQLLYDKIANCRLLNQRGNESLYCEAGSNVVRSRVSNEVEVDQIWDLRFVELERRVTFTNRARGYYLGFNEDRVFCSRETTSHRVRIVDNDVISIEEDHGGNRFVLAIQNLTAGNSLETAFTSELDENAVGARWLLDCLRRDEIEIFNHDRRE